MSADPKAADVRAVLDTVDACLHSLNMGPDTKAMHIARFSEARAAVAELIEADTQFDVAFHAWMYDRKNQGVLDELCRATDIRAAALARCGGAS